jgi:glycosyltransferase involved in cell wall biosynthesis
VTVHPHPIYTQFPLVERGLAPRAGIEVLFYGFVRPYKGLDILVEAMGVLKEDDVFLTIAGEFWEGEHRIRARIAALQIQEKVEVRAHYHRAEETAALFTRADVIVLPYKSATTSGVVTLAYHYDRPVIVTAVGSLSEVVKDGETGRVVPALDPNALAAAIRDMTRQNCVDMRPAIQRLKRSFSWEGLAGAIWEEP